MKDSERRKKGLGEGGQKREQKKMKDREISKKIVLKGQGGPIKIKKDSK